MLPDREHPLYYLDAETLLVAIYVWVDDELKALQAQGLALLPWERPGDLGKGAFGGPPRGLGGPGIPLGSGRSCAPKERVVTMNKVEPKDWIPLLKPYAKPNTWRSLRQVADTLLPLLGLFYLAHLSLNYSLLLTLALDFAAALFLVRLFILQHDAGHGSFFPKKWMNDLLGFFTGVLTLVPYHHWQLSHARHHATSGNLDKRGVGDIYTMTLQEYLEATPWQRFAYRVYRNPFVMFFIGPIYVFMLSYACPWAMARKSPRCATPWPSPTSFWSSSWWASTWPSA
jgi:hypothetical protein